LSSFNIVFLCRFVKVTADPSGQINVIKNGTTNITYFDGRAMYTFEDRDHLFMTVSDGGVIHHPACKCQNK